MLIERARTTSSSSTIHGLPFGLKCFVKPDMETKLEVAMIGSIAADNSQQILVLFCKAMSGFAKLSSPKGKLWIVALLL